METHEWRQIAGWLQAADIDCIEFDTPGQSVRMLRGPAGYEVEDAAIERVDDLSEPTPGATRGHTSVAVAVADCAGIFLAGHPMRPLPLVCAGSVVRQGDLVGLLQIGHLLAPVVAPVSGTVTRTLVTSKSLVGYGTGLVEIQAGET